MADEPNDPPKSGGGCLRRLLTGVSLIGMLLLGVAVFFITRPQDLSDLKGRGGSADGSAVRDLRAVLRNALERNYPVTITEEELNQYLRQTIEARQGGLLGDHAEIGGVSVRLQDGFAEVITERTVAGHPLTLSIYVREPTREIDVKGGQNSSAALDGGAYFPSVPKLEERLRKGGRFGQLVVPQGFVPLVLPAFEKLARVYADELHVGFSEMPRTRIEKGKLVLDPRFEDDPVVHPQSSSGR